MIYKRCGPSTYFMLLCFALLDIFDNLFVQPIFITLYTLQGAANQLCSHIIQSFCKGWDVSILVTHQCLSVPRSGNGAPFTFFDETNIFTTLE